MNNIRSIIWLRLDSIGDGVMSSSMLPYVKEKFKNDKITVVCQKHLRELYEHCPAVDDIIVTPAIYDASWQSSSQYREVLEAIKAKHPALLLNSVFTTHWLADMNGLEFIPKRYAIRQHAMTNYTDLIKIQPESKKEMHRHHDFLRGLGIEVSSLQTQLWLADEDIQKATELLQGVDRSKLLVLVAGAQWPQKLYLKYGEALREICEDLDYQIVAVGSQKDYDVSQKQLDIACPNGINLAGKTTIRVVGAIMKFAKLVVGNDTGSLHVACGVGTPNIVVFGSGWGYRFFPYSDSTSIVNVLDKKGAMKNVNSIPPEMVTKKMKEVLNIL